MKTAKSIRASTELLVNYYFHLFMAADIWEIGDKNQYQKEFRESLSITDRNFIYDNRNLIAWGNGRENIFSQLLFFTPAKLSFSSKTELADYFSLLSESFRNDDLLGFKAKFHNEISENNESGLLTKKNSLLPILNKLIDIYINNFEHYSKSIWPIEQNKLEKVAKKINTFFMKKRYIEKWEQYLNIEFPGDQFSIVLTSANKNAPSANNLNRTRYNFYYQPESFEDLTIFISHEIGTNLLMESLMRLHKDKNLKNNFKTDQDFYTLVYNAFESLAEYYNAKILGIVPSIWEGELFGGGELKFKIFFEFYEVALSRNQRISPYDLMKESILNYLRG